MLGNIEETNLGGGGGAILGLQAKKRGGGGPGWGPILGPMLNILHSGPKGGGAVRTPWKFSRGYEGYYTDLLSTS